MKIKLFLAGCIFLLSVNLTAQSTEWINTTQGSSHEFSNDIALDDSGNIYQVGSFIGTLDFDPTSGVANLTSNNNSEDCFIRKFDANGNFLWAKSIGGKLKDKFEKIAIFKDTLELFTTFGDTIDMDPSSTVNNISNSEIALLKLDKNGNFISYINFNVPYSAIWAQIRKNSFRYVYGYYSSAIDIDYGNNTNTISQNSCSDNLYIAKYDLNFNLIWHKKIECTNTIRINTLEIDANENLIYGGQFKGTFDVNLDAGVKNLTEFVPGFYSYYFSKLDNNGNFIFGKTIPNKRQNDDVKLTSIILSNNNIYFAGSFIDSMDLNPDENISEIIYTNGSQPYFIIKIDGNGNKIFASKYGSNGSNTYGITVDNLSKDNNDNLIISGKFAGNTDFDMSSTDILRNNIGSQFDFYIAKYSPQETFRWFKGIDIEWNYTNLGYSTEFLNINKVLVAPNQKVLATGSFFGNTANFDTANTNFTATPPNGKYEGFLMRFNQPVVSLSIDILDFYGKANQKEQENQLYLKYFTDENKQYSYNVLKSKDGIQWETIIKKQAQINTTENQYFEDQNPFSGINYYKIEVFENDQFLKNSKIIAVNYLSNDYKLSYYNGALYSTIENDKIEIYDLMGKKIMDAHLENYKLDLSILNRNQFYIIKSKDANLKIIY